MYQNESGRVARIGLPMTFGQDAGAGLNLKDAVGARRQRTVTPQPKCRGEGHQVPLAEQGMRMKSLHYDHKNIARGRVTISGSAEGLAMAGSQNTRKDGQGLARMSRELPVFEVRCMKPALWRFENAFYSMDSGRGASSGRKQVTAHAGRRARSQDPVDEENATPARESARN